MDNLYTFLWIIAYFARFSNFKCKYFECVCVRWGNKSKQISSSALSFESLSKMWHKPISIESLFRYIEATTTTTPPTNSNRFCFVEVELSRMCAHLLLLYFLCYVLFCFVLDLSLFFMCVQWWLFFTTQFISKPVCVHTILCIDHYRF